MLGLNSFMACFLCLAWTSSVWLDFLLAFYPFFRLVSSWCLEENKRGMEEKQHKGIGWYVWSVGIVGLSGILAWLIKLIKL